MSVSSIPAHVQSPMTRRSWLRTSLTATAGLTGALLTRTPPLFAQERELKLLTWSHFVPASDDELRRQLNEFGKMEGIKVRMDRVAHLQLPAVLASEVQGQRGHDITIAGDANPHLYSKHLVNLDELHDLIGRRGGGWTNTIMGKGREGHYRAIPWYFVSLPTALRTDLVAEIGEDLPDTWEDVLRIGRKLKAKGYMIGIPFSHGYDSNASLRSIIWCWGGKLVEADGTTVAINSRETVEAYKFMRTLYKDCIEEEVLAWDDRNNNVCLNSSKCWMILNPISAYNSARKDNALIPGTNRPVHQVINHIMPPRGPAGRHAMSAHVAVGIWNWSPVQEAAKKFLDWHFREEQQEPFLTDSLGYNQPFLQAFAMHPIYASNPKFYFAPYIGWYTHAMGWPGVPTAAVQKVWDRYIIPDTAAACVTDKMSAEEAVQKAEFQIKRIYRRA